MVINNQRVAVIIPCFKVSKSIKNVLMRIGSEVDSIYCINDSCPEGSGELLEKISNRDKRVTVLHHKRNKGVGAATISGYRAAIKDGMDILVKLDGDGQMDPELIPYIIQPILDGEADYVKGNRFYNLESIKSMPGLRIFGNAVLSFMSKLSTGYWNLFDPANGYTALHAEIGRELDHNRISRRYFFESDMLFHLSIIRAKVVEIPMESYYDGEISQLCELQSALTFPFFHARNFFKRLGYCYFLRGFSAASLSFIAGLILMLFGVSVGITAWINSFLTGIPATTGTVILAALPFAIGVQLFFSFAQFDIANTPSIAINHRIRQIRVLTPYKND